MLCPSCGQDVPDGNSFCGKCGAHVGQTVEETAGERIKTRKVIEVEIFEAVLERVGRYVKWLGILFAILTGVLIFVFGKASFDIHSAVESGKGELAQSIQGAKSQIQPVVDSARRDLNSLQTGLAGTKQQYEQVQTDLNRYRQVNQRIEQLQRQLATVQGQIQNWYNAMETEVFDERKPSVRFTASPPTPNNLTPYVCELTLKKAPIPASLHITRGALVVSVNFIKVDGRKVTFGTVSDKIQGA